jgi:hypothetical protein
MRTEQGDLKSNRILTAEYPLARFSIQTLHLSLMRLALIRELLGSGPILARISRMALLKRPCHRIALSVRARAQRDVMLILRVDELVLRRVVSPQRASREWIWQEGRNK